VWGIINVEQGGGKTSFWLFRQEYPIILRFLRNIPTPRVYTGLSDIPERFITFIPDILPVSRCNLCSQPQCNPHSSRHNSEKVMKREQKVVQKGRNR